jgi:8-oxo-dGTP pyrophosphatase MutT (NUDIX family)
MSAKTTSCGVIVTDGERLLLGHATRSPRWDIPKGEAEPGEDFAGAARRELLEETGLDAPLAELAPLGVFPYRRGKDLALFCWSRPLLPDPGVLVCASQFSWNGRMWPEFDRFGLFTPDEAVARVGKSLATLLAGISLTAPCDASKSPALRARLLHL